MTLSAQRLRRNSSWESRSPTRLTTAASLQMLAALLATATMPPAKRSVSMCLTASIGSFDDLPIAVQ